MNLLLKTIAFAIYPQPIGLGALGSRSVVRFPRRIHGARGIRIGSDVIVQPHGWLATFPHPHDSGRAPLIEIGDHARIGSHVMVTAIDHVCIDEGCLLSENVFISDHTHGAAPGLVPPARQPLVPLGPVHIGRHCFIGIRACIFGGVTLGDYCVVGANSVVTRSFPAGSVIAGAPARLQKTLEIPRP